MAGLFFRARIFPGENSPPGGADAASLAGAALATPATAPKTLFAVDPVFIPVVGTDEVFLVRRIYCIGRNYAAHAIERGSDPNREPPFFFQKQPGRTQDGTKLGGEVRRGYRS